MLKPNTPIRLALSMSIWIILKQRLTPIFRFLGVATIWVVIIFDNTEAGYVSLEEINPVKSGQSALLLRRNSISKNLHHSVFRWIQLRIGILDSYVVSGSRCHDECNGFVAEFGE